MSLGSMCDQIAEAHVLISFGNDASINLSQLNLKQVNLSMDRTIYYNSHFLI